MADIPRPKLEYSPMAGHLVGLLPGEALLLVGLQENGGEDLTALPCVAGIQGDRPGYPC
jgi:hypothetical protein